MKTFVTGAGDRSSTDLNDDQQAYVTSGRFVSLLLICNFSISEYTKKSATNCKKHYLYYNRKWSVCLQNKNGNDKVMHGDSGQINYQPLYNIYMVLNRNKVGCG